MLQQITDVSWFTAEVSTLLQFDSTIIWLQM
jgi:hypothetical protein